MSMRLEFGYNPVPEKAKAAFGMRGIYRGGNTLDVPMDRKAKEGGDEDFELLKELATEDFFNDLHEKVRQGIFGSPRSEKVTEYSYNGLNVVASPKQSCGYLYITVWI